MGNVDACSKDEELVRMFEENNGPVNETAWQFFTRSYTKFCNSIVNPRRWHYESSDLIAKGYTEESFPWKVTEFKVFSQANTLHACFWEFKREHSDNNNTDNNNNNNNNNKGDVSPPKICILYMHTNQRSIYDVREIVPLAKRLNAHMLSFDLAGCGKSEGSLHGSMDVDAEHLLEWAQCLVGEDVKVVLWARGMSTALAISLAQRLSLAKKNNEPHPVSIACMVLDSPYTAIEDMVKAAIDRLHSKGYAMTKSLLKLVIKRVIVNLSSHMGGLNIFDIKPIKQVKDITIPAFFLTATADDYTPSEHSVILSKKWGGPVQFSMFHGRHYSDRDEDVIMRTYDFIFFHAVAAHMGKTSMTSLFASAPVDVDPVAADAGEEDSSGLEDILEDDKEETDEELLAIISGKKDVTLECPRPGEVEV